MRKPLVILVVEDDAPVRVVLADAFIAECYDVVAAGVGDDAIPK